MQIYPSRSARLRVFHLLPKQAALPTLESLVRALSANADLLAQQQAQQLEHAGSGGFSTPHELAAFSAGVAAAQQQAQAQQAAFDEAQQHYALQQHLVMQQQQAPAQQEEWAAGISPELLAALQGGAGMPPQQQLQQQWVPRRRVDSLPSRMPVTTQAAAQMRARAALTGEPWLGEQPGMPGAAGAAAAAYPATHQVHPFAEAAAAYAPAPAGPRDPSTWGSGNDQQPPGMQHFWGNPAAEGMRPLAPCLPVSCMRVP